MAHPLLRIPPLPPDAPAVLTAKGKLRPHRAILYDHPTLLLHHAIASKAERNSDGELNFDEAFLAGIHKTASRINAILKSLPDPCFQPLQWPTPERLIFTTRDDVDIYETIFHRYLLIQAETLQLCWHEEHSFLIFRRCG